MPSNRVFFRIGVAVLAVAPFATVAAFFRAETKAHPGLIIILLIIWEVLLFAGNFLNKVYSKLQERWADSVAEWADAALRRTLSRYPRQYRYFLSRMHHDVDLRGLSTWGMHTLAMEEVFIDLSLMPQAPHLIPSAPVNEDAAKVDEVLAAGGLPRSKVHDSAADDPTQASPDMSRRSIWEMLDQNAHGPLAVLGPPGSGKTTLLRHVTLVLCGRQRNHQVPKRWRHHIPVLLFLREHVTLILNQPSITLPDVIRQTLIRLTKVEPPGWFDRQLDSGRCLVMLDGLDEVARIEDRAAVMKWVRQQIDQYPRNRFILTSRPFGFMDPPLISATVLQVRQFTDAQVEAFVRGWYRAVEQRSANRDDVGVRARAEEGADKLLRSLYSTPALLTLATNPLLLTMITSVHKYRAALPGSRAELYREICQVFLGKRQEAKELSSELSIDQKTLVLRHLAFVMMDRRVRDIPNTEACALISPTLARVSYQGTPTVFLTEIEQTTGLLIERDNGIYTFAHLTFQEYLAALHVAETKPIEFLVAKLGDSWWREVTLLRVANADATPIVQTALQADPPNIEMLSLAAECIDQAREVSSTVRKQLADVLSWRVWKDDPNRRRLAAQVLLTRKLQHVVRSSKGIFICSEPVLNAEYNCFLHDLGPNIAEFRPATEDVDADKDALPAVGMAPQAADQFAKWVQTLGVDLQLPMSPQLTPYDIQRMAKPPATRFWARAASPHVGSNEAHFALLASSLVPTIPDFLTLLNGQLNFDFALLKQVIPPEKRSLIAVSPGTGLVDVKEFYHILEELAGDNKEGSSTFGTQARNLAHQVARDLVSRLLAVTREELHMPSPKDTYAENAALRLYRAKFPKLIASFAPCWAAGRQWGLVHCNSLDERIWLSRGPFSESFLNEFDAQAAGMTPAAQVIRSYARMTVWALASARSIEGTLSNYGGKIEFKFDETVSDILYCELAGLYLTEWRIQGLLPPQEGLLLVRA
jgi:NACHT domain